MYTIFFLSWPFSNLIIRLATCKTSTCFKLHIKLTFQHHYLKHTLIFFLSRPFSSSHKVVPLKQKLRQVAQKHKFHITMTTLSSVKVDCPAISRPSPKDNSTEWKISVSQETWTITVQSLFDNITDELQFLVHLPSGTISPMRPQQWPFWVSSPRFTNEWPTI